MSDPLKDISVSTGSGLSKEAQFWLKELDLASKREKKWRKKAEEVWELYEGGKRQANSFNILYSNTETLLPACYNQLPRPVVDRRFKDPDPTGKAAGETLQRTLAYLMDSPEQKYEGFSSLMEQAVLGALVPGRGVTRFKYDPEFADSALSVGKQKSDASTEDDSGGRNESPKARVGDESGDAAALFPEAEGKKVVYETICGEDVAYDGMLLGYARRWKRTPWVAFYHAMTKEDLVVNFGEAVAKEIKTSPPGELDEDGERKGTSDEDGEKNLGSIATADVYEIWHKASRTVIFFSPQYEKKIVKTVEDPLKLSGFYPIPEPLVLIRKGTGQTPRAIYELYEEQAKELNLLSRRINKVASAIKVRGFYDKTIQGIEQLMTKDDNTLIPASNVPALQQGQTLDKSIWLMPIEDLIEVLGKLVEAREACKGTIYEITGIADLMRGDTQASETATAQAIKDRWGSIRVKRVQRYVQEYVRECLRLMGEIAGQQFAVETFAGITGLDYATDEEVAQAQKGMQQIQAQMAAMPPGPDGQPAPPPPQVAQFMQQAQATLAKPKWSEVKSVLENDLQRGYKIDIETNSTIDATSQEDKQNMQEALGAIGTAMQTFVPAVQSGILNVPVVKTLLLAITRRFEFGKQVEDALMQLPDQPPPQGPDPKQVEQAQQQVQQQQEQLQQQAQKLQQQDSDLKMREQQFQNEFRLAQKELELQRKAMMDEMKLQQKLMDQRMNTMMEKHSMMMDQREAQVQMANQQAAQEQALAAQDQQRQQQMAAREAQGREKAAASRHKEVIGAMTAGQKPMMDLLGQLVAHASAPPKKRRIVPQRDAGGRIAAIDVEG